MRFGNWTIYIDIPLPFTRRALIFDLGLRPGFGWRYR